MKSNRTNLVAELADQFGSMVFATAYRILGNKDEANDAYQEVFLKIMKARSLDISADQVNQWGAYLRVTASRCAINILQRRPKWDLPDSEFFENLPEPGNENPRTQNEKQRQANLLRKALASLSEQEAHIFALRYFEDLTYEEIARQEEMTTNGVGVILHRAVQHLKTILEPLTIQKVSSQKEENHD